MFPKKLKLYLTALGLFSLSTVFSETASSQAELDTLEQRVMDLENSAEKLVQGAWTKWNSALYRGLKAGEDTQYADVLNTWLTDFAKDERNKVGHPYAAVYTPGTRRHRLGVKLNEYFFDNEVDLLKTNTRSSYIFLRDFTYMVDTVSPNPGELQLQIEEKLKELPSIPGNLPSYSLLKDISILIRDYEAARDRLNYIGGKGHASLVEYLAKLLERNDGSLNEAKIKSFINHLPYTGR